MVIFIIDGQRRFFNECGSPASCQFRQGRFRDPNSLPFGNFFAAARENRVSRFDTGAG